jgi:type I restriction enzyme S subunit
MSDWQEYKLGEIGFFNNGVTKSKSSFGHGYPFVNLLDIFNKDRIDYIPNGLVDVSKDELNRYNLIENDILFVRSSVKLDGVGKVCVVTKDLENTIYSGFIIRFRQYDTVLDKNFSSFYLNDSTIRNQIISKGTLSANSNINQESLKTIRIKVPDLPTQRKIAYILSTADEVIEKTQAAIAKYKAIKQGMLHDLFARGIDPATNKLRPTYEDAPHLYKQSKLGWIPREWEVKRIKDICSMKSGEGITSLRIKDMENYPVYGGNGLRGYTESFTHDGEYTLIGRQGALCGNITRVSGKFYASEHAVVVTVERDMDVDWLSQKLETMQLNQYSEASAQPGLSVNKIMRLFIAKPLFEEQNGISNCLISTDNKLQIEQTYLHKLQQIKAGLMADLLSGKKEVRVDEEPVS